MAALAKVESLYQEDLSKLIHCLTGFEEEDENAEICYKFAMSHLLFNKYLSANKWQVNRKLDGIIEKLQFHGLPGKAEKLRLLVKKFIVLKEAGKYEQVDLEWQILQLLLCLAHRPSDAKTDVSIDEEELIEPLDPKLIEKKKREEWVKYLREDDERFNYIEDDKSDWSDLESEEETGTLVVQKEVVDEPGHASQFHWPPLFPKSEPTVKFKSKKEFMKCKLEQSTRAENHLKTEVQHSWWNINEEISKMGDHPSLSFTDLATSWRPSGDGNLLMVLSEKKILREVLWTLHCPANSALFELDESGSLTVRKNFTLATASQKSTMETVTRLSSFLQICWEMLSFRESLDFFQSSFTLQAYANTLAEVLEPFKMKVISLEKQLDHQDSIVTLLNLEEMIAPFYMDLKYVYQIHLNATSKHDSQPKWMATSRLLSELEIGLLEAISLRQTDIMLRLFIKSLRVSIDIIDQWLSTGHLEDFKDEFLIVRSDEDKNNELPVLGSFVVRRIGTDSKILNCLTFSALKAARSMEFALKMNDARSIFLNNESGLMYEQFLSKLGQAVSEVFGLLHGSHGKEIQLDVVESPSSLPKLVQPDMQYYKDLCRYHPLIFNVIEKLHIDINERLQHCDEAELMSCPSEEQASYDKYIPELPNGISVFPLIPKIESILESLITSKHDPTASQLKQYLITKASLLTHLEILHKVYLLEPGHTLVRFYNKMFFLAEADLWKGAKNLSPLLEDCIEKDVGEFSERFEVIPKENPSSEKLPRVFKVSKTLKNIDNIYIHYEVESPVNIVISEEALNSYNFVYQFLSKIKWAQWSLQQLNVKDLKKIESDPKTHRLLYLRFFLLNSVSQIHNHFVRQISGDILEILKREIIDAVSLDAVLEAHKSYLKKLTNHCLRDDIVLKKGLFPYLSMCKSLKNLWTKQIDSRLKKEEVVDFEKSFVKIHWNLTFCVDTAINMTSSKYSGPLAELWKVLSTNIPTRCDSSSGDVFSNLSSISA